MRGISLVLFSLFAGFAQVSCQASPAKVEIRPAVAPVAAPAKPRVRVPGIAPDKMVQIRRSYGPSPSRDGSQFSFLSDITGVPQIFLTASKVESKREAWMPLAPSNERVAVAKLSADEKAIFFARDQGGNENTQLFRIEVATSQASELTNLPKVKFRFGALSDSGRVLAYSSNERSAGDFDVYVRNLQTNSATRILDAAGDFAAEDVSPDDKTILVVQTRSSFDQDLFLIDAAKKKKTALTPHSDTQSIRYEEPHFSKDGRVIFVLTDKDREFQNVGALAISAKGEPSFQFVITSAHDFTSLAVSRAEPRLAVAANVDGYSQVRIYDVTDPLKPRVVEKVELPLGVVDTLEFSGDGRSLFFSHSRANMPNEVYRVSSDGGQAQRLTSTEHGGVDESLFVEPTLERFASFDGISIPVFVFRPRSLAAGERAPVIVVVHGGPEAQFTPSFNPTVQFLVSHGYVVAAPNVRGSTGYGKRFAHLDDIEYRENSVRDLAALNMWLREKPFVDPKKIAITGGSYGGYMTLAAITLFPEMWAAACDIVGIANFETFLERTAPYRRALREAEYGSITRDKALLNSISPIHKVNKIKTPLLVIHGANDPRVPVNEAEQIVAALKSRQQNVEYLRFENEGHGVVKEANRIVMYKAMLDFFEATLW